MTVRKYNVITSQNVLHFISVHMYRRAAWLDPTRKHQNVPFTYDLNLHCARIPPDKCLHDDLLTTLVEPAEQPMPRDILVTSR